MKEGSVINNPVDDTSQLSEKTALVDSRVRRFRLQPDTEIENATSYALADLLKYHDRTFVLNVYAAIAKQPPDANQLTQTLEDLRGGRRSKTEIVEDLLAKYPNVRVEGLSSPTIRRLSRWPVIGYGFRVVRAIARLPMVLQHQQQFENYVVGQQQRMADYVNERPRMMDTRTLDLSLGHTEVADVSDAIKTVLMLSDSLVELSGNVAEGENRLQTLEAQHAEFATTLRALTETLETSVQQIQRQREQSEAQLHGDVVALTNQLSVLQQHLEEVRRAQTATASSQREFLIDEQRAIVETQRAAFSDLQEQLDRSSEQYATRTAELTVELRELRAAVEEFQQTALRK